MEKYINKMLAETSRSSSTSASGATAGAVGNGTVRVFRQKFTLGDAIGSHAFLLSFCTINCVQTLKV
jgi:hypothetical protein